jgi:hypothetical protein
MLGIGEKRAERWHARLVVFWLGIRDASLLKRDGLPLAAFFNVDTGEHYLAGRIFSPQHPLHVGLASDDRGAPIHAYFRVPKLHERPVRL